MSAEYNQIGRFPKNLSYNLAKLNSSILKQKIKVETDKFSYGPNEILKVNLPIGRMIDTRSMCLYAKTTSSATGSTGACQPHLPRGGLNSLFEQFQVTCNGKVLQSTQYYNYIWNCLADVSGYYSQEQVSKRVTELFDPSITYTNAVGEANPVITNNINNITAGDTYYLCANSFLGFFNGSVSTINTNDFGNIQISITLAPETCMWFAKTQGNSASSTGNTYKLEEVRLCLDTITFTNSTYYELVKTQLEGGGLNIGYYDYLAQTGNSVSKSATGITFTSQINCSSLDQVIATFRPETYATIDKLYLANGINETGAVNLTDTCLSKILADPETNGAGYTFNNSAYFVRDGGGFDGSSWYINSQPFTQNASAVEVINNNLQALNYGNLDIASGGFHSGVLTTGHFFNHYFVDILSLENESGDNNWWVSGLSSNGGTIQIQYQAKFKTKTNKVIPYLICRVSKILNVKMGRLLDLME